MKNDSPASKTQYFATLPSDKLCGEVLERVLQYDDYVRSSGLLQLWKRSYSYYNLQTYKAGRLNRLGEQGEYTEMGVNHFRNLLLHIQNMTTNQRPSFDARAANTDRKSQAQTLVANGILDYYNRYKGLDQYAKTALDTALQFANGYIYQGWDFSLGDPYIVDDKNPSKTIKQGDVLHKNFTPMDVIFDFTAGLHDAPRQWYVLRDFQNKWDLIARYPEMRDEILRAGDDPDTWRTIRTTSFQNYSSDFIPIYLFIHDRTDSMPDGRFFTLISKDCWFVDTTLMPFYKKLPVYDLCGMRQLGSGFGYTMGYDLLPIQEAINGLYSIIITNQSTFGVQNILSPKGGNISLTELSDGLNLVEYDPKLGKPEALNLVSTPQEIFAFIERLESVMETISGVNSVARGNPEESLKSGSALALVQSMAIQFISGLQQSYANLLEDLGTGLINILQACATTPRMTEITGKANKSYLKEFTGKDIASISRVTVDLGNPVARTTAGKVNIADNLLQAGLIQDPQQYLQVLTTGKIEPLIEGQQAELMLIRAENEGLADGQDQIATMVDNHSLHVLEHKAVLASPDARSNPQITQAVLSHIQQHLDLWNAAGMNNPGLLMLLKEPMPPMPAPPAPPEPQAPGTGPAPAPAPGNGQILNAANPVTQQAAKVKLPNMPKNPLNGQPAHAAAGG